MDQTNLIVGLGGALFGGAVTKLIERLLPNADKRIDADAQLRKELWEEIETLRTRLAESEQTFRQRLTESEQIFHQRLAESDRRISELEGQSTEWRERYFKLLEKYNSLEVDYKMMIAKCQSLEVDMFNLRTKLQDELIQRESLKHQLGLGKDELT